MWRRDLLGLGLVLALPAGVGCRKESAPSPPPVAWDRDLDAAMELAKSGRRSVIAFFGAAWDAAAVKMNHETWTDPRIRALIASRFAPVLVDMTDEDPTTAAQAERLRVKGTPETVVVRATSLSIDRIDGFRPPDAMLSFLRGGA